MKMSWCFHRQYTTLSSQSECNLKLDELSNGVGTWRKNHEICVSPTEGATPKYHLLRTTLMKLVSTRWHSTPNVWRWFVRLKLSRSRFRPRFYIWVPCTTSSNQVPRRWFGKEVQIMIYNILMATYLQIICNPCPTAWKKIIMNYRYWERNISKWDIVMVVVVPGCVHCDEWYSKESVELWCGILPKNKIG